MMLSGAQPGFFVGYFKKVPNDVKAAMVAFILFFLGSLALIPVLLSLTTESPGAGRYVDELRGATLSGTIEFKPYPILRVPATQGRPARAIMLAGSGKFGVDARAAALADRVAQVRGVFVKRGDLEMLLVGGGDDLLPAATDPSTPGSAAPAKDLGKWRLTGEICDGKCAAGAMKPGLGLAHKACANLCIVGGVPPVFVSTSPVGGHRYFLLASKDGGPMPAALLDKTAVPVVLEGRIEQRDDLAIFKVERFAAGSAL